MVGEGARDGRGARDGGRGREGWEGREGGADAKQEEQGGTGETAKRQDSMRTSSLAAAESDNSSTRKPFNPQFRTL